MIECEELHSGITFAEGTLARISFMHKSEIPTIRISEGTQVIYLDGWHEASSLLPEIGTKVLVYLKDGTMRLTKYKGDGKWGTLRYDITGVTHWCYRPTAPVAND